MPLITIMAVGWLHDRITEEVTKYVEKILIHMQAKTQNSRNTQDTMCHTIMYNELRRCQEFTP